MRTLRADADLFVHLFICLGVLSVGCAGDRLTSSGPDATDAGLEAGTKVDPDEAGAAPDTVDIRNLNCSQLSLRWGSLVGTADVASCQADVDCVSVGGSGSCSCTPTIGGCGTGANGTAYDQSDGPALEAQYRVLGCTLGGMCDCGSSTTRCLGGKCTASATGCSLGGASP